MALVVNNATVATGMSPQVERGLYADAIFIDGVTFTSNYQIGAAGQVQVLQYQGGRGVKPGTPGADFDDRDYENTVININMNNSFKDSAKVPAYFEASMPPAILAGKVVEVTMKVGTGRQEAALAALVDQGTLSEDTEALTKDNLKNKILEHRSILRKKHAKPGVVLASVDTYSMMLDLAGKEFSPMYNDEVARSGKVGMWMGLMWLEVDLLDGTTSDYSYLDEAGQSKVVDTSGVDFIMYDAMAYSLLDRLDALRVIDSENFIGSKVQEEIVSGFKVTNQDCVLIKKKAAG